MATVRQRVRDSKKCFIHAHAFFRFMQSVPTSHKHGTAELAFRAIRMESRMSGESAAPFTCTLRACSRDRRCAHDDGAPHVAAHMNARALAASTVTSQPARIEGNRRPRMPHFTPWLSRRLRSTRRTIAAIRVRSDPIHVLRADGPRYVLARPIRARRSSFVAPLAFAYAARVARRRTAFRESARPAFARPPIREQPRTRVSMLAHRAALIAAEQVHALFVVPQIKTDMPFPARRSIAHQHDDASVRRLAQRPPHSSHERASAEPVPGIPTREKHQLMNDEHHETLSS